MWAASTDVIVTASVVAPVASLYGDAVLAMAVKLDGFLAIFPPNVTPRTTTP